MLGCPRCSFRQKFREKLQPLSLVDLNGKRLCWLAERKQSWPGRWAVGCVLCFNLAESVRKNETWLTGGNLILRACAGWAKFEVRRVLKPSDIQEHSKTDLHHTALKYFLDPASQGLEACSVPAPLLRASVSGKPISGVTAERPFGDGVPQPADYLRVWAHIRSVSSARSSQAHSGVERFCHDDDPKIDDSDVVAEPRREMKQIAFVMAEVVRQDDRAFLRRSTDCTLCIDASASKNVISFVAACASDDVIETREGLIGIIDEDTELYDPGVSAGAPAGAEQTTDEIDAVRQRKSDRSKREILASLRKFRRV